MRWLTGLLGLVVYTSVSAQDIPLADVTVKPGTSEATSDHIPYDGGWWPATGNEMLHALERFSAALEARLGWNPRLDMLEHFRHYVGPNSPIRPKYERNGIDDFGWWGHCNGYSAAAVLEKEPPADGVSVGVIKLSQEDLKGILAEAYYHADARMLGTRSQIDSSSYTEAKRLLESGGSLEEWRRWFKDTFKYDAPDHYTASQFKTIAERAVKRFEDINPADFHKLLHTVIGNGKMPLVLEVSTGYQVWNYPAYSYSMNVRDTGRTTANGHRVMDVTTTVKFKGTGSKTYTYELHVDSNGKIRGGAWTGTSVTNHPDFAWIPTDPDFKLNDLVAEAVVNNIFFDVDQTRLLTGNREEMQKLRASIEEVMNKAAPSNQDPGTLTNLTYQRVRELLSEWRGNPWLQLTYGGNLRGFLQQGLSKTFSQRGMNVDLYKELEKMLAPDHRGVSNVDSRLREAATSPREGFVERLERAGPR